MNTRPLPSPTCETPMPVPSQVSQSIGCLDEAVGDLDRVLTELIRRLEPVLSPIPKPADNSKPGVNSKCALAEAVDQRTRQLHSLAHAVRSTLDDLAL